MRLHHFSKHTEQLVALPIHSGVASFQFNNSILDAVESAGTALAVPTQSVINYVPESTPNHNAALSERGIPEARKS